MEAMLERSLANLGFAQAIVIMKPSITGVKEAPARVVQNFMSKMPLAASTTAAYKQEAPPFRYFPLLGVCVGYVDSKGATQIEAQKDEVEAVFHGEQLSLIWPVRVGLAKLRERLTWGLRILKLETLWDRGFTGKGARVGHLDTGIDAKHKALRGKVKGFMEFDMSGERVPGTKPYDSDEHGTHTAGTICGGKIGGRQIGMAPGADLYSGLVIEGGQVLYRVLNGMEWCLENKVRVLSMSLGLRGYTPFFVNIMRRLRTQGVLPVMAIGNEGPGTSRSPGNYSEALSVGAVNSRRRIPYFSSNMVFNRSDDPRQPNVVAPGVDVVSAKPRGGAQSMDGTSMATPHVAGLAALLFQIKPDAPVDEVENAIQSTCDPLRHDPSERYGFGLINPVKAVEKFAGPR